MLSEIRGDLAAATGGVVSLKAFMGKYILQVGFRLMVMFRIASALRDRSRFGRVLGRWVLRRAAGISGCHFSIDASIAPGLRLPHATGIVIGSGAKIGENCTIYQNVTIGALDQDSGQYPTISERTTIFAGAVIVGGVTLGADAIVGANAVVLGDVPARTTVAGVPARTIAEQS